MSTTGVDRRLAALEAHYRHQPDPDEVADLLALLDEVCSGTGKRRPPHPDQTTPPTAADLQALIAKVVEAAAHTRRRTS